MFFWIKSDQRLLTTDVKGLVLSFYSHQTKTGGLMELFQLECTKRCKITTARARVHTLTQRPAGFLEIPIIF